MENHKFKFEQLEEWLDSLEHRATYKQLRGYAEANLMNKCYVFGRANVFYLKKSMSTFVPEGRKFEKDIQHFVYDIESDIKGVDVDEVYNDYLKLAV